MPPLYPIFLKVKDCRCAVIGGGEVGVRKVKSLLEAGACVTVVAPEIVEELKRLRDVGEIEFRERGFEPSDLDGCRLCIAATDNPVVNMRVRDEAARRGLLCNVVDQPEEGDFFVPSSLARGDLRIAVSTGGKAPEFAREIRLHLEEEFGGEYARALELAEEFRLKLRGRFPEEPERRMRIMRENLNASELADALRRDDKERLDAILSRWDNVLL